MSRWRAPPLRRSLRWRRSAVRRAPPRLAPPQGRGQPEQPQTRPSASTRWPLSIEYEAADHRSARYDRLALPKRALPHRHLPTRTSVTVVTSFSRPGLPALAQALLRDPAAGITASSMLAIEITRHGGPEVLRPV